MVLVVVWVYGVYIFDQLCLDRPVYALDIPGFAHSSRPEFSSVIHIEAEQQFVEMIGRMENWN